MQLSHWKRIAGPGLIFASTAIGVSHLVQSTRAGADYGFALIGVVILANVFKYPSFEYGVRYAVATGQSLVHGYKQLGRWAIVLLTISTLGSMFAVTAAVSFVCAGIMSPVFGDSISHAIIILLLFVTVGVLLWVGKFPWLDRIVKLIATLILISTFVAFFIALWNFDFSSYQALPSGEVYSLSSLAFLVALVGWMPSAIDISVMSSIWTIEKAKSEHYRPTLKEALLEFRLGYLITAVTAILFLGLGAMLMFGAGEHFSDNATVFAQQFFALFTTSLGAWSYPIILVSAISVMFSTVLAVFDGYSRVMSRLVFAKMEGNKSQLIWIIILGLGSYLLATAFAGSLKGLVDFATTVSFVIGPIFAAMNMLVISKFLHEFQKPGRWLWRLSWLGLIFLTAFAAFYLLY